MDKHTDGQGEIKYTCSSTLGYIDNMFSVNTIDNFSVWPGIYI